MNLNALTESPIKHNLNSLSIRDSMPTHDWPQSIPAPQQSATQPADFYAYQKEPWLTDPGYELVANREDYIERKKSIDRIDLALIQLTYNQFRDQLAKLYPDIIKKTFGFTLGPDANLLIINNEGALTEHERYQVTELINGFQDLRAAIQHHAKNVMILAQHDYETFGAARNIDLSNFHKAIDYHRVLGYGTDGMHQEWVRQVGMNTEQKSYSYISTKA